MVWHIIARLPIDSKGNSFGTPHYSYCFLPTDPSGCMDMGVGGKILLEGREVIVSSIKF
jgi:hypothetical protein